MRNLLRDFSLSEQNINNIPILHDDDSWSINGIDLNKEYYHNVAFDEWLDDSVSKILYKLLLLHLIIVSLH